jgi:predicted subunit of tRNA(5-methylaminomethyl-2-thiouridylate) methyltransferase
VFKHLDRRVIKEGHFSEAMNPSESGPSAQFESTAYGLEARLLLGEMGIKSSQFFAAHAELTTVKVRGSV